MRLIDADALMETLGIKNECDECEYRRGVFCARSPEFINACEAICDAPTIEPRKTGHWIVHRDWIENGECGYECSECHRCYDYNMNFCGYCGCKMEVEHE